MPFSAQTFVSVVTLRNFGPFSAHLGTKQAERAFRQSSRSSFEPLAGGLAGGGASSTKECYFVDGICGDVISSTAECLFVDGMS